MPAEKPKVLQSRRLDRRAVLLGSALLAPAPLAAATEAAPEVQLEPAEHRPRYQETEHMRKFYASNRY